MDEDYELEQLLADEPAPTAERDELPFPWGNGPPSTPEEALRAEFGLLPSESEESEDSDSDSSSTVVPRPYFTPARSTNLAYAPVVPFDEDELEEQQRARAREFLFVPPLPPTRIDDSLSLAQWMKGFHVGSRLDKKGHNATHRDHHMSWYSIDSTHSNEFFSRVVEAHERKELFQFSEEATSVHRPYLDLETKSNFSSWDQLAREVQHVMRKWFTVPGDQLVLVRIRRLYQFKQSEHWVWPYIWIEHGHVRAWLEDIKAIPVLQNVALLDAGAVEQGHLVTCYSSKQDGDGVLLPNMQFMPAELRLATGQTPVQEPEWLGNPFDVLRLTSLRNWNDEKPSPVRADLLPRLRALSRKRPRELPSLNPAEAAQSLARRQALASRKRCDIFVHEGQLYLRLFKAVAPARTDTETLEEQAEREDGEQPIREDENERPARPPSSNEDNPLANSRWICDSEIRIFLMTAKDIVYQVRRFNYRHVPWENLPPSTRVSIPLKDRHRTRDFLQSAGNLNMNMSPQLFSKYLADLGDEYESTGARLEGIERFGHVSDKTRFLQGARYELWIFDHDIQFGVECEEDYLARQAAHEREFNHRLPCERCWRPKLVLPLLPTESGCVYYRAPTGSQAIASPLLTHDAPPVVQPRLPPLAARELTLEMYLSAILDWQYECNLVPCLLTFGTLFMSTRFDKFTATGGCPIVNCWGPPDCHKTEVMCAAVAVIGCTRKNGSVLGEATLARFSRQVDRSSCCLLALDDPDKTNDRRLQINSQIMAAYNAFARGTNNETTFAHTGTIYTTNFPVGADGGDRVATRILEVPFYKPTDDDTSEKRKECFLYWQKELLPHAATLFRQLLSIPYRSELADRWLAKLREMWPNVQERNLFAWSLLLSHTESFCTQLGIDFADRAKDWLLSRSPSASQRVNNKGWLINILEQLARGYGEETVGPHNLIPWLRYENRDLVVLRWKELWTSVLHVMTKEDGNCTVHTLLDRLRKSDVYYKPTERRRIQMLKNKPAADDIRRNSSNTWHGFYQEWQTNEWSEVSVNEYTRSFPIGVWDRVNVCVCLDREKLFTFMRENCPELDVPFLRPPPLLIPAPGLTPEQLMEMT
jgi:hypothetical protein